MTVPDTTGRSRFGDAGVLLLALAGAALATWQFAAGASLWLDELALVRNVVERSWGALLFRPLSYQQVAPAGFLALEKAAIVIGGNSDHVARVVPFLCTLGSLVAFGAVCRHVLGARGAIVAMAIVALSGRLIWNGSQVKQYSGDVFVACAILWIALWLLESPSPRRAIVAALAGMGAALLSQPAAFVLTAGALAFVIGQRRATDASRRRALLVVAAIWVGAVGAAGLFARSLVAPDTMAFMRDFWTAGFPPLPPRSLSDLLWPWAAFRGLFGTALTIPGVEAYAVFSLLGLAVLLWRRHPAGVVVAGALALAMMAAAARLFPFNDRPVVFAIPLAALACGAGAEAIGDLVVARQRALAWSFVAVLVAAPVWKIVRHGPVFRVQETRPLIQWAGTQQRVGDEVYVFYGAWQAFHRYSAASGLDALPTVWGRCHLGDPRAYYREIDALRGKARVWVIMTHAQPTFHEYDAILGYLDAIGARRSSKSIPDPPVRSVASADVYLYDLSDPARLATATAITAPVPDRSERPALTKQCFGPFMP